MEHAQSEKSLCVCVRACMRACVCVCVRGRVCTRKCTHVSAKVQFSEVCSAPLLMAV